MAATDPTAELLRIKARESRMRKEYEARIADLEAELQATRAAGDRAKDVLAGKLGNAERMLAEKDAEIAELNERLQAMAADGAETKNVLETKLKATEKLVAERDRKIAELKDRLWKREEELAPVRTDIQEILTLHGLLARQKPYIREALQEADLGVSSVSGLLYSLQAKPSKLVTFWRSAREHAKKTPDCHHDKNATELLEFFINQLNCYSESNGLEMDEPLGRVEDFIDADRYASCSQNLPCGARVRVTDVLFPGFGDSDWKLYVKPLLKVEKEPYI